MKKSLKTICGALAGVLGMAATGQAMAADLAMTAPSYVDPVINHVSPASDYWTGFYAGGHLGRGFVEGKNGKDAEFSGGLQAGYNHQIGNFVVGAELEGSYTNKLDYLLPGGTGGLLRQNWGGSAKARAGFALDRVLIFGTLGVGVARLEAGGAVTSGDVWAAGVAFGGGAEVAFTESLSGKLEYTQTRFDGVNSRVGGVQRKDDLVNHTIKAGLNYRF